MTTAVYDLPFGLALDSSVVAALNFPCTTTTVPAGSINSFAHSAQSNYHALTARLERRFHGGFSLLSAFTYSKAISNAPQYRNAGGITITGDENSPPQNSYDLAAPARRCWAAGRSPASTRPRPASRSPSTTREIRTTSAAARAVSSSGPKLCCRRMAVQNQLSPRQVQLGAKVNW